MSNNTAFFNSIIDEEIYPGTAIKSMPNRQHNLKQQWTCISDENISNKGSFQYTNSDKDSSPCIKTGSGRKQGKKLNTVCKSHLSQIDYLSKKSIPVNKDILHHSTIDYDTDLFRHDTKIIPMTDYKEEQKLYSVGMALDQLAKFRTQICPRKSLDDSCFLEEKCPFSHCLSWHRRNPMITGYRPSLCPNVIFCIGANKKMRVKNYCHRGRLCLYSHTKEEQMYHPLVYKTQLCRDWPNCEKYYCPFAHGQEEMRLPQQIHFSLVEGPEKPERCMELHRAALATHCWNHYPSQQKHSASDRIQSPIRRHSITMTPYPSCPQSDSSVSHETYVKTYSPVEFISSNQQDYSQFVTHSNSHSMPQHYLNTTELYVDSHNIEQQQQQLIKPADIDQGHYSLRFPSYKDAGYSPLSLSTVDSIQSTGSCNISCNQLPTTDLSHSDSFHVLDSLLQSTHTETINDPIDLLHDICQSQMIESTYLSTQQLNNHSALLNSELSTTDHLVNLIVNALLYETQLPLIQLSDIDTHLQQRLVQENTVPSNHYPFISPTNNKTFSTNNELFQLYNIPDMSQWSSTLDNQSFNTNDMLFGKQT